MIYGIDSIHGANYVRGATLFPQEIGMAATFNPELKARRGNNCDRNTSRRDSVELFSGSRSRSQSTLATLLGNIW